MQMKRLFCKLLMFTVINAVELHTDPRIGSELYILLLYATSVTPVICSFLPLYSGFVSWSAKFWCIFCSKFAFTNTESRVYDVGCKYAVTFRPLSSLCFHSTFPCLAGLRKSVCGFHTVERKERWKIGGIIIKEGDVDGDVSWNRSHQFFWKGEFFYSVVFWNARSCLAQNSMKMVLILPSFSTSLPKNRNDFLPHPYCSILPYGPYFFLLEETGRGS